LTWENKNSKDGDKHFEGKGAGTCIIRIIRRVALGVRSLLFSGQNACRARCFGCIVDLDGETETNRLSLEDDVDTTYFIHLWHGYAPKDVSGAVARASLPSVFGEMPLIVV
jgi:hypothetical protein